MTGHSGSPSVWDQDGRGPFAVDQRRGGIGCAGSRHSGQTTGRDHVTWPPWLTTAYSGFGSVSVPGMTSSSSRSWSVSVNSVPSHFTAIRQYPPACSRSEVGSRQEAVTVPVALWPQTDRTLVPGCSGPSGSRLEDGPNHDAVENVRPDRSAVSGSVRSG